MTDTSTEAREKIDGYLDAVEAALTRAGVPRERRRSIVDDLEAHIGEMIAETPQPMMASDVDTLLARLDPPDSYARSQASVDLAPSEAPSPAVPTVASTQMMSIDARYGFVFTLVGPVCVAVVLVSVFAIPAPAGARSMQWRLSWGAIGLPLLALFSVFAIVGCIYGWIGLSRIGRSQGRLSGAAAAGFAALLIPTLLTWLSSFAGWYLGVVAYYGSNEYSDRKQAIVMLGGSMTAAILTGVWIWSAARLTRGSRHLHSPGM